MRADPSDSTGTPSCAVEQLAGSGLHPMNVLRRNSLSTIFGAWRKRKKAGLQQETGFAKGLMGQGPQAPGMGPAAAS